MADELKQAIQEHAEGPASAEVDGQRVTQHKLKDQIEADTHLAGRRRSRHARIGRQAARLVELAAPGLVAVQDAAGDLGDFFCLLDRDHDHAVAVDVPGMGKGTMPRLTFGAE